MKLITRNTDYAIRALCFIARKNTEKIISAAELVACLKINKPFLRKILQVLNKKSFLSSFRGKGGGFTLLRSPDKISLAEVIDAFQGPIRLNDHKLLKKPCPKKKYCKFKKKLDCIEDYIISELRSTTIASLL